MLVEQGVKHGLGTVDGVADAVEHGDRHATTLGDARFVFRCIRGVGFRRGKQNQHGSTGKCFHR